MKIYDPPLGPDDPLFVPMDDADCPSKSPPDEAGTRFLCTLAAGHKGDHLAHVEEDEVWASWPAEGNAPLQPTLTELIGALLDEWEGLPNDLRGQLDEEAPELMRLLGEISNTAEDVVPSEPTPDDNPLHVDLDTGDGGSDDEGGAA